MRQAKTSAAQKTSGPTARGRGIAAGLSTAMVSRAALELADEGGLAALSVRGVARRLKVKPMSIYHYFQNKDALLDALWDEVLHEGVLPDGHPSSTWQDYLRQTAYSYREALLAHPKVLPLMLERQARTQRSLDLVQRTIAGLRDRGLPLMVAVDLVNVVSMFTIAHTLSEHRYAGQTEPPPIDPARNPLLLEIVALSAGHDPAEDDARRFREAIEALIDGYDGRIRSGAYGIGS